MDTVRPVCRENLSGRRAQTANIPRGGENLNYGTACAVNRCALLLFVLQTFRAQESHWGRWGCAAAKGANMGKSNSNAKTAANRLNAKDSTGPKNTSSTRFNAIKHGLLAAGITEIDDADEYRNTLRGLDQSYLAELERFLLGRIALNMIRLRRSGRLEAEYITAILNPPIYGEDPLGMPSLGRPLIDPGLPAPVNSQNFAPLVNTFQRYDTALENKLFRAMHELERLRRMKDGEQLPAPATVDVNIHADPQGADSFVDSYEKEAMEGSLSEPPDKPKDPNPADGNQQGKSAKTIED